MTWNPAFLGRQARMCKGQVILETCLLAAPLGRQFLVLLHYGPAFDDCRCFAVPPRTAPEFGFRTDAYINHSRDLGMLRIAADAMAGALLWAGLRRHLGAAWRKPCRRVAGPARRTFFRCPEVRPPQKPPDLNCSARMPQLFSHFSRIPEGRGHKAR